MIPRLEFFTCADEVDNPEARAAIDDVRRVLIVTQQMCGDRGDRVLRALIGALASVLSAQKPEHIDAVFKLAVDLLEAARAKYEHDHPTAIDAKEPS